MAFNFLTEMKETIQILENLPRRIETKDPEHPAHRLVIEGQDTRWMIAYVCTTCKGKLFYTYGDTLKEVAENAQKKIKQVLKELKELNLS